MYIFDICEYRTHSNLGLAKMLQNFHVSFVEVEKSCSEYAGTLPLIFSLLLLIEKYHFMEIASLCTHTFCAFVLDFNFPESDSKIK